MLLIGANALPLSANIKARDDGNLTLSVCENTFFVLTEVVHALKIII